MTINAVYFEALTQKLAFFHLQKIVVFDISSNLIPLPVHEKKVLDRRTGRQTDGKK